MEEEAIRSQIVTHSPGERDDKGASRTIKVGSLVG